MTRIFSLLVLTTFLFTACGKKDEGITYYEYKTVPTYTYEPDSSKSEKEKIAEFKSGLLKALDEGKEKIIQDLKTKPNYSPRWDDKVTIVISSLKEKIKNHDSKTLQELKEYAQTESAKSDKELESFIKNQTEQDEISNLKSDFFKQLDQIEENILNEAKAKNYYSADLENKVKNVISSLKEKIKNYEAKTFEEFKDYGKTESKKAAQELDNLVKNAINRFA